MSPMIVSTTTSSLRSATNALPPISSATFWSDCTLRATTVTFAPRAANSRAIASPMPLDPPVTTTCAPLTFM